MTTIYALDLETAPNEGDLSNGYALEPWRLRQQKAHISSLAVAGSDGTSIHLANPQPDQVRTVLKQLRYQEVWCQNTLFDVAWLIAAIEPDKTKLPPQEMYDIRWRDTLTLAKWIVNGWRVDQSNFSYSLSHLCSFFLKGEVGLSEYLQMKAGAPLDPNSAYWHERGLLDVLWTLRLAQYLWPHLKREQQPGYIIECGSIVQIADSWLTGLYINQDQLRACEVELEEGIEKYLAQLNLDRSVVSSPTQLGRIVYDQWGLPIISRTPTGLPQCNYDTFKLLEYTTHDPRLSALMSVRENLTLISKYVKTTHEALSRTGDGYIYPIPKIFGTTTGRLTYSNQTTKKDGMKVSIAIHQLPRKAKAVRRFLEPPPGLAFAEYDAMSQESRIMAIWSGDPALLTAFRENKDLHALMAGYICGTPYEEIVTGKKNNVPHIIEFRQMGKLTNLSCNFRIGGAKLAKKAFTEYDMYMAEEDGHRLTRAFRTMYKCVPKYWTSIVNFAKEHGYTYTLAQRRWKIPREAIDWKTEGTIISHPIQGTAGEQMYAAIASTRGHKYIFNLHDGQFYGISHPSEASEIFQKLNSINYSSLWDYELPIPLPFEMNVGTNLAEVK